MDKIDKDSSCSSEVTFGKRNIWRLLFADDLVSLSSNKSDLQHALECFSYACLNAEMKIKIRLKLKLRVCQGTLSGIFSKKNGVTLQQTEKLKHLGVIFPSDGKQDKRIEQPYWNIKCSNAPALQIT